MAPDMKTHTPGPWKCIEAEFGDYQTGEVAFVISSEAEPMVASVKNCKLIAAAPALLDALKEALVVEEMMPFGQAERSRIANWRALARAAIAKAE